MLRFTASFWRHNLQRVSSSSRASAATAWWKLKRKSARKARKAWRKHEAYRHTEALQFFQKSICEKNSRTLRTSSSRTQGRHSTRLSSTPGCCASETRSGPSAARHPTHSLTTQKLLSQWLKPATHNPWWSLTDLTDYYLCTSPWFSLCSCLGLCLEFLSSVYFSIIFDTYSCVRPHGYSIHVSGGRDTPSRWSDKYIQWNYM